MAKWVVRNNNAEHQLYHDLQMKGYSIYTRGWPDCIAHNPETGDIRFIEVKPAGRSQLKAAQVIIHSILARYGIKVELHRSNMRGITKGRGKKFRAGNPYKRG